MNNFWACSKIIYHFGIPAAGHSPIGVEDRLCPMLIQKTFEIASYSSGFAQSHRPNLT